ncbi:MAG: plasmid mobilization relaxosome protein MobC, partial [Fusicatenibacter saccharivorans]
LNQYAKRANESGSIYAEDIRDLQKRLEELWEMQKLILKRLSGIR